jgi:hypothetical protein
MTITALISECDQAFSLTIKDITTVGPGNFVSTILGGQAPLLTAF